MPQRNVVPNLQALALEIVCQYLIDVAPLMKKDEEKNNRFFIENLHATLRSDIMASTKKMLNRGCVKTNSPDPSEFFWFSSQSCLAIYTRKHTLETWNSIMNAMLDVGVRELPCLYFYDNMNEQLSELISILQRTKTNFKKLSVEFVTLNYDNPSLLNKKVGPIKCFLETNIVAQLTKLVLHYVCNNEVLKIIGANALALKHLDVSNSSCFNDLDFTHLLLKDIKVMNCTNLNDVQLCKLVNSFSDNEQLLNLCCKTIEVLLFTPDRCNFAGILMSLVCIKNLKIVGLNGVTNHVGDILLTLWENSAKPQIFKFIDMYDYHITENKLIAFGECLPFAQKLFTDFDSLITSKQNSKFWNRIKVLDIDCNTCSNTSNFFKYLNTYGRNLESIYINNYDYSIDLNELVKNCPNLERLHGGLDISERNYPVRQLTQLKYLNLINPTSETSDWLFKNCPQLEEMKIMSNGTNWNMMDVIKNPPLVLRNDITDFSISFYGIISIYSKTIKQFIFKCSKLKKLGGVATWNSNHDVSIGIKTFAKRKNLDLTIY